MQNFHDLLDLVLRRNKFKPNRTGTGTFGSVGHMLKYDLTDGRIPLVTTKRVPFKSIVGELLGFFRGYTSAADFRALGCKVWDQNANETPSWVNNPNRKGTDDLGRIYGVQWTGWRDTRITQDTDEARQYEQQGYELKAFDPERTTWVFERTINQLEEAARALMTDRFNRRVIINGWRPDEFDRMALPPCHVAYQFIAEADGELHSTLWIRSNDLFLGHPFNAASLAVFTHIMARLTGLRAASATVFISDAHVYENHVEQTLEQLSREHYDAPRIVLSERIQRLDSVADIKGAFERIEPEDIQLEGYRSHPAIQAPMAA